MTLPSRIPSPAPQARPKQGLLLVHPRLHDPTPANATTFLRWTKLHFRDLLNIPDTSSGHVTQDLRFVAPEGDDGYTQTQDKKEEGKETSKGSMPKYLYTCLMDDIAFLKTEAYMGVSRRLNLEKSRNLEEGEVGVGFLEEEEEGEDGV